MGGEIFKDWSDHQHSACLGIFSNYSRILGFGEGMGRVVSGEWKEDLLMGIFQ